ncbi:uncharacterized protein F5147DRAFT_568182 [Suillus discolor]|uniref:Uncharacterized protein n=1 Tax=Suillus discolor TaxID=1912936 RepID=A0A9P7JYL1_9AGAM|nr:uncharacterized protein F5147DRAFT_568182 [Suillus discolor]KAG2116423.1 hypothetical protein F5147DRAFT_568182 [Suillus discolor]
MSQPDAVATRMGTRPKNATQHPGRILINNRGKKRTTAEKATDDQRQREAKEASEKAVQESYQCIATLQAHMQADQDAAHVDAPKPKRPHARPVGKAAKDLKTSDSTMDDGQAGAKIVADKPVVTKGRGREGGAKRLAADAGIEHPASEDEEPVQTKKKKKLAVREAIHAVLNAGIVIDSTKACDREVQKTSDVSQKFALAGHVPGWLSNLPATAPKPAESLMVNLTASSIYPQTSHSKLTRGSTISSNVPPPLTPISTSNAGGFTEFNIYVSDEDEDDEELAKPLSHITSNKAYTVNVTHCGATEQSDLIEDADDIDVFADIHGHFIDSDGADPATQPDFLREYYSANHEPQSPDRDSDLEPPPLAQKPRSRSTTPMDFDSLASQKRKLSPPLDYDNIMELSSEAKSVQGANEDMKTEPVDPVFTRRVTSTTNVAATLKAPPAKRTLQRLSEWHNTFSNVALAILANFMTSQDDLKTDEDRQAFALALLENSSTCFLPFHMANLSYPVFQMERAIRLFVNGHMLLGDIDTAGNGRGNKTPLDVNPSTGNQSSVPLAFSEVNWGAHMRAYMASIKRLPDSVLIRNLELAQSLAMKRRGAQMDVDEESGDERALIF